MDIENWPIDRPTPYPRNARKLSPEAIEKVAASLQEFGWRQPIVVDCKGVVICGHTRLLAARSLGATTVPVHVAAELTPAQVKAYRLMDNRSHEETSWETVLLGGELFDLKGLDFDLRLTGFNPGEIDGYLAALDITPGLTDEDAVPEIPERPVTVAGDLWLLGQDQHKLLVGDSTDPAAVARLMAGDSADLIITDPPYNVDYEGYTEERLKIKGDRMSDAEFKHFLDSAFRSCRAAVKPGASLYVCHSSSWQREFQNALESAGFEVRCQIIWAKNTFAWGFGRYKFQHEPLFYAHVADQKDAWYGDKSQSTLWEEKKPAANRLHPTAKPVELIERALMNSSKAGDLVVDLFGGSGSTLIACERRARKARLMELDPKYAHVIVRRYQEYSGKTAVLDGDGRSFHEIAQERLKEAA
jgi:DNA modification methylase